MIGIPPFPAHEKTALCLDRAVNSVGWQSIFSCFYMYPFVNRRKQNSIENSFGIIYPSIGGSTWDRSPVVTPTYLFSDYILASYIKSATNQGVTTKVDIKALFCFEHVTDDSLKYLQDMINELQLESRSDRYQEVHFYFYPETEKDIDHIKDSFSKMFAGKDTFKYYLMDNRRLSRIYYES